MKCLNETILHAYLDGELNTEHAARAATHLAACATCAEAWRELEREANFINTLLSDLTANDAAIVPTQRLKARLDASINQPAQSHQPHVNESFINGFKEFFNFAPLSLRTATTFASLLIVVIGLIVLSVMFYERGTTAPIIAQRQISEVGNAPDKFNLPAAPLDKDADNSSNEIDAESSDVIAVAKPRDTKRAMIPRPPVSSALLRTRVTTKRKTAERKSTIPEQPSLPGEASYLEAIALLFKEVERGSLHNLPPAAQADYLQNLKIVDSAIVETGLAARRDPTDGEAAEYLRAAYQNKLNLLSAIAAYREISELQR